MTNRHKIYTAGIALVLTAGLVLAQTVGTGRPTSRRQRATRMMQFAASYLDLTDAQKEQAKTTIQQAAAQVKPLMEQLKQDRQALQASVKTPLSDADLQKLATAQGQTISQLIVIRTKTAQRLYGILTPDQQAKADHLRDAVKSMMQSRMQGRIQSRMPGMGL